MSKLFQNDDLDAEEINVNTDYAKNYDSWRQKEELHKLKARYGEDVELLANSEEDSSESSEDDDGEEIPEEFEKNFYKTLACLKNKDPKIYNENVKFFNEPVDKAGENEKQSKKKKEKSVFLRDYERQVILEKGGKFSDSENEEEKPYNPTYVQEQEELKKSFKQALQDEDKEDLLFKPRSKTKEEVRKEEEDYKEWLKGQKKEVNEEELKDLKPLKDFWTDPNLDKNEKFLRDYVLDKKFLDKETSHADLGYEHFIHDSDENLSEDEKNINQQEEFEHKYNFRFEEPDQEFIKRYPRTLEDTLRKKDTRRVQKRIEVKERKEHEKLKKHEELKQLKALKRKEIEEKIEKLKEITGNDDLQLNMVDLEGDFDPAEYDKKMSQIFNEEYYAGQEDDMKPEFPEIDEELAVESTWDNYDPTTDEIAQEEVPYHDAPHCEDPDFNMDADYDGQKKLEELDESSKKRKRRRRSKFAEMISKEKPKFDPTSHSSFQEYYDQYYALDYEDMIGDLPCRFKYRQVMPNDYGLTVEEILMADDKELNKWCSLKRALEYKPDHKELNDVKVYRQKAANETLKRKILRSLYTNPEEGEENEAPIVNNLHNTDQQNSKKKRKRKKKTQQNQEVKPEETVTIREKSIDTVRAKKSKKKNDDEKPIENGSTEADDKNSTDDKVKDSNQKKGKIEETQQDIIVTESAEKKKKKKKNKNNLPNEKSTEKSAVIENQVPSNSTDDKVKDSNQKKRKIEATQQDITVTESVGKKKKKKNKNNVFNEKSAEKSAVTENQIPSNSNVNDEDTKKIKKQKKSNDPLRKVQNGGVSKKNKNKDGTLSKKELRKQLFKKLNKAKEKTNETDQIASMSSERLKAYGLNPKKFKNKLKYMKK